MLTCGVDGGGTGSRLEIWDDEGIKSGRYTFGPFNHLSIGEAAFRERLAEILATCGDISRYDGICIGAAGASSPRAREIVQEVLTSTGFRGSLVFRADHEIALRGAFDGPGAVLIAGTGSAACGCDAEGKTIAMGGNGHLIDDEGSGYALGKYGIRLALRDLCGQEEHAAIRDAILREARVRDRSGLIGYVYGAGADKSRVARMSRPVLRLAREGCPEAAAITERGADELSSLARAMCGRLALTRPRVALTGGLLDHDEYYYSLVAERVKGFAEPVRPAHDALWGAAMTAREAVASGAVTKTGRG